MLPRTQVYLPDSELLGPVIEAGGTQLIWKIKSTAVFRTAVLDFQVRTNGLHLL